MNKLYQQMAIGAGWMTLFTVTHRLLGLISTIILARLLIPADFGIIAMSMSMIAALELLTGLEAAGSACVRRCSRASACMSC